MPYTAIFLPKAEKCILKASSSFQLITFKDRY